MNRLTEDEIAEHHATLRIACDPDSPFHGMIDFSGGLLALPVSQQHQIYNAMPDDLRNMVEGKGN